MEFLSKEVFKHIKIDTRNIEIEDLPMFFPEVKIAPPEPKPTYTPITFNKNEEVEDEPRTIQFSKSISNEYEYKNTSNNLTGDLLTTFVKEEILDALGLGKGDKMKQMFKTNTSLEDIEEIMKFFETVKEISEILADNKITPKTLPISSEIENLVCNCHCEGI